MQDTNNRNGRRVGSTSPEAQQTSDGPAVDLPAIATIALSNCPSWAGDIVANIPAPEASSGAEPISRQPVILRECPLHTAMRQLAEAAVAQHVLYVEGEVRARPHLVGAIARWERMHTLIRQCVCPATREVAIGAPVAVEIADRTLEGVFTPEQQHLRTQLIRALEACVACTNATECPLDAVPDIERAQE